MTRIFLLAFAVFLFGTTSAQQEPARIESKFQCDIEYLEFDIEMYLDNAPNGWVVSWDSVNIPNRNDCEIWVTVFENGVPIEHYKGLSTPMTHTYFQPSGDKIELSFSIGNMYKINECMCYFERIELPLVRTKRSIRLKQDKNWYFYKYLAESEFEESLVERDKYQTRVVRINSELSYLNLRTGRIRSGKKWMRKGSIYQIVERWDLVPLFPYQTYNLNDGQKIKGDELIEKRKFDSERLEGLREQFFSKRYWP